MSIEVALPPPPTVTNTDADRPRVWVEWDEKGYPVVGWNDRIVSADQLWDSGWAINHMASHLSWGGPSPAEVVDRQRAASLEALAERQQREIDFPVVCSCGWRCKKVRQAAEAYVDGGGSLADWPAFFAAVKGEQP